MDIRDKFSELVVKRQQLHRQSLLLIIALATELECVEEIIDVLDGAFTDKLAQLDVNEADDWEVTKGKIIAAIMLRSRTVASNEKGQSRAEFARSLKEAGGRVFWDMENLGLEEHYFLYIYVRRDYRMAADDLIAYLGKIYGVNLSLDADSKYREVANILLENIDEAVDVSLENHYSPPEEGFLQGLKNLTFRELTKR